MSLESDIQQMAKDARQASFTVATLSTDTKNKILNAMANALTEHADAILLENQKDLNAAAQNQLSDALVDRLTLTKERIAGIANALAQLVNLPDPVGAVLSTYKKDNGLVIEKVRVPIGVIGIIFESRPNVTVDVSGLCLKSGNAVILRGGREALHTNLALYHCLNAAGLAAGLPEHAIQFISDTDRAGVKYLSQAAGFVDCIIPRGGERLIESVMEWARVPVIKHYKGLCHTYVHDSADPDMALNIIENAKVQRPGVCNAMETLLIDEKIAPSLLPKIAERLSAADVELRGDEKACAIVPSMKAADEVDWQTEYLDLILSIRIVDGVEAAIDHINHYGSHHSDAIVAADKSTATRFVEAVDSASVYINASTRFTDGGEFGMGAEIGISTDKLHARGPMGLEELCSYKYIVRGTGQVRQ
jgi:glutamate-5-semialdehyde dehydrogenase